jgi:hypothetical protein
MQVIDDAKELYRRSRPAPEAARCLMTQSGDEIALKTKEQFE